MARLGGVETDGRRARAERNRDAVVEAILDLLCEGVEYPTAEVIAERSGVSVRSVFRHFDDLESLHAAAVDRHSERIRDLFEPPPVGGSLASRIDELAARRSQLFEAMTPVRVVGERLRGRSEVIDERLEFARELLRSQLTTLFEPELARQIGTARRDLLDAIEVATSWGTWNLLRADQGCSVARARAVVTRTLTALLFHP
jgi:TetR/AcrR family transcriptional regulator, regulator of autoinduction and epiphytic fitness